MVHDGVRLTGDLYHPTGLAEAPVVVAVHCGGWQARSASRYKYWGPWLAKRGMALFAIDYRLVKYGENLYPASVHDARAALQYMRANAQELQIHPDRIGLMGGIRRRASLIAGRDRRTSRALQHWLPGRSVHHHKYVSEGGRVGLLHL